MKCPICGEELRKSEDEPGMGLCDNCKIKFEWKDDDSPEYADYSNYVANSNDYAIEEDQPAPEQGPAPKRKRRKRRTGLVIIAVCCSFLLGFACGAFTFLAKLSGGVQNAMALIQGESVSNGDSSIGVLTSDTALGVGDTATLNNVQITLTSVKESSGDEYAQPDSGNIFLLLEFDIANNSSDDITISSIANFEAYCDDSALNQDLAGLLSPEANGKNQLDGSVAAGKKMNGIIAYQVPTDYKSFEINVAPDFWSSQDVKFIINK